MQKQSKKIAAIVAGGSGGHVFPALATAEQLLTNGYKVLFITDTRGYKFIKNYDIKTNKNNISIHSFDINGKRSLLNIFRLIKATFSFAFLFKQQSVSIIASFGSYLSVLAGIAAFLAHKKFIIHEQNSVMGTGNKIASIFSNAILLSFEQTFNALRISKNKYYFVGMPLREKIRELAYKNDNSFINYSAFFKIYHNINILVVGGSQGAKVFSTDIPQAMVMLDREVKSKLRVYHQVHENDIKKLEEFYFENGIDAVLAPFFTNIGDIMSSAHLMISRSGSGSISEIAALGVPSILIPLPTSAGNHQLMNAKHLCDNGAAILLEQSELTPDKLNRVMQKLFHNDTMLSDLSTSVKNLAIYDAEIKIAAIIDYLLGYESEKKQINPIKKIVHNVGIG